MALVDAKGIQDLIDRLEALKRRQTELIDEQIELTRRLAETIAQNEQARDYLAEQRARVQAGQEARRVRRPR